MTLGDLILAKRSALCERWRDAVLAEYGPLTASRWRREKDPFANPVGHALAAGLPELVGAVAAEGGSSAAAVSALEDIVRIRSVQDMAPSRAVAFVWRLRDAIRAELGDELAGGTRAAELAEVEGRIERLALEAFDAYVALREQVFRLRQEELKRSVSSILRRWHGGEIPEPESAALAQLSPPHDPGARR